MKAYDPFFKPRTSEVSSLFTHYLLLVVRNDGRAIGEAARVTETGNDEWHAFVGFWFVAPETGRVDPELFSEVNWMTVRGPEFKLVPKSSYKEFLGE